MPVDLQNSQRAFQIHTKTVRALSTFVEDGDAIKHSNSIRDRLYGAEKPVTRRRATRENNLITGAIVRQIENMARKAERKTGEREAAEAE